MLVSISPKNSIYFTVKQPGVNNVIEDADFWCGSKTWHEGAPFLDISYLKLSINTFGERLDNLNLIAVQCPDIFHAESCDLSA